MDKAIRSPPKPPSRSEHLLIVDDEKDTADVMKMALERAGFSVDVFYHPTTALQEFIAGKSLTICASLTLTSKCAS
jgi:DNA-binding response OmpR family regulator